MKADPDILLHTEKVRKMLTRTTSRQARSAIGQFHTPAAIACFMASLFEKTRNEARILDAGAGAGGLFSALVSDLCSRPKHPKKIEVVAYENDKGLIPYLADTMELCRKACERVNVHFAGVVLNEDFIPAALGELDDRFFARKGKRFTHAILNPPYKKISSATRTRKLLDAAGLRTSNLYAAFVWLSAQLLMPGGELVAITPRSFCNGPYFKPFRKALLAIVSLSRFHLFKSRKEAFAEDAVLQENVIFYGVSSEAPPDLVKISVSQGTDFNRAVSRGMPFAQVVVPGDPDKFIHLIEDDAGKQVIDRLSRFSSTLRELGLEVSTGRVVDFRARKYLRQQAESGTAPLIYPCHFRQGFIHWPSPNGKKPNAIVSSEETRDLLVKQGCYVLAKRFSAKEERRRVVAAVYDPGRINAELVGFENHLNYFHTKGQGLLINLAKGLALFLNSTLFDCYFRLFSGHTQVNAADLQKMGYPSRAQLLRLGKRVQECLPDQAEIDEILEQECEKNDPSERLGQDEKENP